MGYFLVKSGKTSTAYPLKLLEQAQLKVFSNPLSWKVFTAFQTPRVPIDVAKDLEIHEQKVYYYLNRFKKAGLVKETGEEQRYGTIAKFYQITDSCFGFQIPDQKGVELTAPLYNKNLEPFIQNSQLQARIIVGSPDPHGPWNARASDSTCAIDFALFLGGHTKTIALPNYKLDTEVREKDLKGNLILIGGPTVNMITNKISDQLPITIDVKEKHIQSSLSKKTYGDDEYGVVVVQENPWDPAGKVLVIAGKRFQGTRAAIIALIQETDRVFKGNQYAKTVCAHVIRGFDADGDGIIDDAKVIE